MSILIGIADTTFSKVNMGEIAERTLREEGEGIKIRRITVPGIKDLPRACITLLEECDIAMALGMPGGEEIDKQCAHEASQGIISAQLTTGKPVIEVFVHEDEAESPKELVRITRDRTKKHCINALMMSRKSYARKMIRRAGTGRRQGRKDVGSIE